MSEVRYVRNPADNIAIRMHELTREELEKRLDRIDDDTLISFATTCSNAGIRLSAKIQLRKRYPSDKIEAHL